MLRCELENQKNDLEEANQLLEESVKKASIQKCEIELLLKKADQDKVVELERSKMINACLEEEIQKVYFKNQPQNI